MTFSGLRARFLTNIVFVFYSNNICIFDIGEKGLKEVKNVRALDIYDDLDREKSVFHLQTPWFV